MPTQTELGNRLDALNKLFAAEYNKTAPRKLTTKRTWPQNNDVSAIHPFVCPIPGDISSFGLSPQGGYSADHDTLRWTLVIILGAFEMGIPTESVQLEGEVLQVEYYNFYRSRTNLLHEKLDTQIKGLVKAETRQGRGITPMAQGSKLASITFPMDITVLMKIGDRIY